MKFLCEFCKNERKSESSRKQHQLFCTSNPNRRIRAFIGKRKNIPKNPNTKISNQYIKAKELGLPKPEISDITRQKLSESCKKKAKEYWAEEENRIFRGKIMKEVAANNPESYSGGYRGRTHEYIINNTKLAGIYEKLFFEYCLENNIKCKKNIKGFTYEFNGSRTYYPDFYLEDYDIYVETKGYQTERDLAKWKAFPEKLIIIKESEIKIIKRKEFNIQNYI